MSIEHSLDLSLVDYPIELNLEFLEIDLLLALALESFEYLFECFVLKFEKHRFELSHGHHVLKKCSHSLD